MGTGWNAEMGTSVSFGSLCYDPFLILVCTLTLYGDTRPLFKSPSFYRTTPE